MRLEQLTIENFKCFKAKTSFDLGKITLLTGANSSGKSSVMHALLGALQTEDFPYQYSPNGHFVEMGDFEEMVYKGEDEFLIGLRFDEEKNGDNPIESYETVWSKASNDGRLPSVSLLRKIIGTDTFEYMLGDVLRIIPIPLSNQVANFEKVINFIGSNRLSPSRTYYQKAKSNFKVGVNGENYLDQIYDWQIKNDEKLKQLVEHLKEMKILQNIKAVSLGGGRFEIRLQTNNNKIENALSDVGFGVSQFMPIIVADLQLPENSTLMVAQPEIHLHPSIQSAFGDYLVKQVKEQQKYYIIETHSEYLLNKIRLLIVKGEIAKEEVSVYFMDHNGEEAKAHKIIFNEDGQILNAPENFFKTYMMDVMDIAIEAAE